MTAYMIVDLHIEDPDAFETYRAEVPALIAKHGGEYVVRGGEHEIIEGDWRPGRLVMFRFPDRQAVRNFFDDPEYKPLLELRHNSSRANIVAVDGL